MCIANLVIILLATQLTLESLFSTSDYLDLSTAEAFRYLEELDKDFSQLPFTDIYTTLGECSRGSEPMFTRTWKGTKPYSLVDGKIITEIEVDAVGASSNIVFDGVEAIEMTKIHIDTVCGLKAGSRGSPYRQENRVDDWTQ